MSPQAWRFLRVLWAFLRCQCGLSVWAFWVTLKDKIRVWREEICREICFGHGLFRYFVGARSVSCPEGPRRPPVGRDGLQRKRRECRLACRNEARKKIFIVSV